VPETRRQPANAVRKAPASFSYVGFMVEFEFVWSFAFSGASTSLQ